MNSALDGRHSDAPQRGNAVIRGKLLRKTWPVTGDRAVDRFVDEIYESLHGELPLRDDALA